MSKLIVEKCKWKHYLGDPVWKNDCGKTQGINVRPRQKICYCGRQIDRVEIEDYSEIQKMFAKLFLAGDEKRCQS